MFQKLKIKTPYDFGVFYIKKKQKIKKKKKKKKKKTPKKQQQKNNKTTTTKKDNKKTNKLETIIPRHKRVADRYPVKNSRNLPSSNLKSELHNINGHTKFDEIPLIFTQVIVRRDENTDRRTTDGRTYKWRRVEQTEGHTDD